MFSPALKLILKCLGLKVQQNATFLLFHHHTGISSVYKLGDMTAKNQNKLSSDLYDDLFFVYFLFVIIHHFCLFLTYIFICYILHLFPYSLCHSQKRRMAFVASVNKNCGKIKMTKLVVLNWRGIETHSHHSITNLVPSKN